MEESQHQYSFRQRVPKEISFTDFFGFISGKQVMYLIQYTVLEVMVEGGK